MSSKYRPILKAHGMVGGSMGFQNPLIKENAMIADVMWIWVGVVSLWVVLSIAQRISSDHRRDHKIVDRQV
jgi:hypothetical protein